MSRDLRRVYEVYAERAGWNFESEIIALLGFIKELVYNGVIKEEDFESYLAAVVEEEEQLRELDQG